MKSFQEIAIDLNNEIQRITAKGKITQKEKELLHEKHFALRASFNNDVYYTEASRDYTIKGYSNLIEALLELPLEEEQVKPSPEEPKKAEVVKEETAKEEVKTETKQPAKTKKK